MYVTGVTCQTTLLHTQSGTCVSNGLEGRWSCDYLLSGITEKFSALTFLCFWCAAVVRTVAFELLSMTVSASRASGGLLNWHLLYNFVPFAQETGWPGNNASITIHMQPDDNMVCNASVQSTRAAPCATASSSNGSAEFIWWNNAWTVASEIQRKNFSRKLFFRSLRPWAFAGSILLEI